VNGQIGRATVSYRRPLILDARDRVAQPVRGDHVGKLMTHRGKLDWVKEFAGPSISRPLKNTMGDICPSLRQAE